MCLDSCPICNSKNIEDLDIPESNYVRPFEENLITKLGFCNDCTFLFCLNPLNNEYMQKYYEKNFQLRSTENDLVEEHVHASQANFIDRYIPIKNKKILEIGANTGKLLNHLKVLHGCKTYFDELNQEAVKILSENQNHIQKKSKINEKFDVIIMRHVLEHIVNPIQYLENLKEDLSDKGVLFIEVPDFTFLDNKNDTLLFEHVNYFSQLTLSSVLNNAGYIVVSQQFSITENYATCSDRVLRILACKKPLELKEGIPLAIKNHQHLRVNIVNEIMDELISKSGDNAKIAFYAASWWTERYLLNSNLKNKNIVAMFDKDVKKQGTIYNGIKVYPPSEIKNIQPKLIFVLTSFEPQIKQDLKMLNYSGKIVGTTDLLKMLESRIKNK